jgi:serine/threonine protein kinase
MADSSLRNVGPYALGEPIGSGGLGTVYAARGPDGPVAVKVLHRPGRTSGDGGSVDQADDEQWENLRKQLAAEIAAARHAAGAGVVRIVGADLAHDPPYLVMELVDAPNLFERRRRDGPLTGDRLDRFATSLLTAMSHIHLAGIVHGDLKPTNVLVADDGASFVVDFGLASQAAASPPLQRLSSAADGELEIARGVPGRGTPGWRAPEVERGEMPTIASDVYGWGRVVDYAAASNLPSTLASKVDAALSNDLARRRAVYVPPAFPIADSQPAIPETVPPIHVPVARSGQSSRGATSGWTRRRRLGAVTAVVALAALAVGAVVALRGGPADGPPVGAMVIYDEAFQNGFSLNLFNGINDPASTVQRHSGEFALATTPTSFDGFLVLMPDDLKLAEFGEVRLWMRFAQGDAGAFTVSAMRDTNTAVGTPVPITGVTPGEWSEIVVPLDQLIVDRVAYDGDVQRMLWFNSAEPTSRPTIYADDITLVP